MASTSWNGRKLWLKSQIGIMRINALVRTGAIPLSGVDFWHIFETQVIATAEAPKPTASKREMYEGGRLQVFYIRMIHYQVYKLNCRDTTFTKPSKKPL
jgi:hypothetical protein